MRPQLVRRIESDAELVACGGDAEPRETQRTAWISLRGLIQRPMREDDGIGARAPGGIDRHADEIVALLQIDERHE